MEVKEETKSENVEQTKAAEPEKEEGDKAKDIALETPRDEDEDEKDFEKNLEKKQTLARKVNDAAWIEQRECALLLLRARIMLRKMVEAKRYEEKLFRGGLSALEVHNLISSQDEGDDTDFIAEITELKRNLLTDIRKNHALEKDATALDKKIGLLIHNVGSLAHAPPKRGGKKGKGAATGETATLSQQRLAGYSNLFYLLQTEPKYLARLIGCMEDSDEADPLVDTIILTLFGDAFSPREEFLILTLFKMAIEQEMKNVLSVSDFVGEQSILTRMVMSYNKRKLGKEYMRNTFSAVMAEFLSSEESMELNGRKIHQRMIAEAETASGVKSDKRTLTEDEIEALPEVRAIIKQRAEQLEKACQRFLDKILSTVQRVPFGLRWICKQHRAIAQDTLEGVTEEDLNKLTAYFVYYRFINVGIVSPETFGIVENKVGGQSVLNLIEVSKVLHRLFLFSEFDSRERWYKPMNKWIKERIEPVQAYINDLLDVENPEDALQVDRYIGLMQLSKPSIIISVHEITNMHTIISENIDRLATSGPEDKLRVVMRDLGPPETYADSDREIQLTLTNRFPESVDDPMGDGQQLFHKTKTALISIMRQLPKPLPVIRSAGDEPTLAELLRAGSKWAKSEGHEEIKNNIERVRKNIEELEGMGLTTAKDGHRSILKAVTLEIANRAQIREQQNKELARLRLALRKAAEQQRYLNEQISQYNQYLQVVRERHVGAAGKSTKKRSKNADSSKIMGPFKFSYLELVKKRIIVESEVPKTLQKATKISISSEEPGVFDVDVKIPGLASESIQLFLDDLLDKQSRNLEHDERANITLDVNMTIHLLNKLFAKGK